MCKNGKSIVVLSFWSSNTIKFYLLFGIEISDDIINVKNKMTLAEAKEAYAKGEIY